MIQIYCAQLVGEPFLLERERSKVEFGFYRNEYIVSWSKESAIAAAKAKTLKKFADMPAEMIEDKPMVLKVEKITSVVPPWRLFRNEGFLLFRVDSE